MRKRMKQIKVEEMTARTIKKEAALKGLPMYKYLGMKFSREGEEQTKDLEKRGGFRFKL